MDVLCVQIENGEELAYDYRYKLLPGKGCPCHCGASNCRGRLYWVDYDARNGLDCCTRISNDIISWFGFQVTEQAIVLDAIVHVNGRMGRLRLSCCLAADERKSASGLSKPSVCVWVYVLGCRPLGFPICLGTLSACFLPRCLELRSMSLYMCCLPNYMRAIAPLVKWPFLTPRTLFITWTALFWRIKYEVEG